MTTEMSLAALSELAVQTGDAFAAIFGKQPGFRLAHAKGIVCHGTFTASAAAKEICRAEHFRGGTVAVIARFSDSTGVPGIPDYDANSNPKGLALRFVLSNGKATDIVSNGLPGFVVSRPQEFLAFLKAVIASPADAPKPTAVEKFLGEHPGTAAYLGQANPTPASFGTQKYFGNSSFIFTDAGGKARAIRYQIEPVAGEKHLDAEAAAKMGANFLMEEIKERIAREGVEFRVMAQVAEEGDPTADAMKLWPGTRRKVELGMVRLSSVDGNSAEAEKKLIFDPTHLTDGISLSDDPLPAFRSAVYSVSYERRQG